MNSMHETSLECLANAHRKLDSLPGVNPVRSAADTIAEVAGEDPHAPAAVGRAQMLAEQAESVEDAQAAADVLADLLSGTGYDPENPESHHPYNRGGGE